MAEEPKSTERFSLSRWSRRKLEAARAAPPAADIAPAPPAVPASAPPSSGSAATTPVAAAAAEGERPDVETLTFESDFGRFLKPDVDPATQRAALKKLFGDPRFNVMDGLDTYVDDYTQADPMPAGLLSKLGNVYAMSKEDAPASGEQSIKTAPDAVPAPSAAPAAIEAPKPVAEMPAPIPAPAATEKRSSE